MLSLSFQTIGFWSLVDGDFHWSECGGAA